MLRTLVTLVWATLLLVAAPVTAETVIEGELAAGDTPPLPANLRRSDPAYLRDLHPFEANAYDFITISLTSEFDAYLILLGPDGTEVTSDDDSGGSRNSLIENYRLPQTGTYQAVATSYGTGDTGPYTLTISTPLSAFSVSDCSVISRMKRAMRMRWRRSAESA